jgi:hypothetical protein
MINYDRNVAHLSKAWIAPRKKQLETLDGNGVPRISLHARHQLHRSNFCGLGTLLSIAG